VRLPPHRGPHSQPSPQRLRTFDFCLLTFAFGTAMDPSQAVDLARHATTITLMLSAPAMVVALAIGLVVSIAQAVTQIQEQTIQFVPKLVAMLVLTILLLPWTLTRLMEYSTTLIKDIPSRL
jgi:flagellar biosynthetic protein FliQ